MAMKIRIPMEKRHGYFDDYMDELVEVYVKELKGINKGT